MNENWNPDNWKKLAPSSVADVQKAGRMTLGTRDAYVVVRRSPGAENIWFAQLGLGDHALDVPRLGALGKGRYVFESRESAIADGIYTWRVNLSERVAVILEARGGTLDWGFPVEPLLNPAVVLFDHGCESPWDVARSIPRWCTVRQFEGSDLLASGELAP